MNENIRTEFKINELIAKRWSPNKFADRLIERDKLNSIFEAARWSPSSFNEQPWRFLVAIKEKSDAYNKMLECLSEFNRSWASSAPVLISALAKKNFEHNNKPNPHAVFDLGLAVSNLTVQATEFDIYLHQMAGFSVEKFREYFNIEGNYKPVVIIAMGYLEETQLNSGSRKPVDSFVEYL